MNRVYLQELNVADQDLFCPVDLWTPVHSIIFMVPLRINEMNESHCLVVNYSIIVWYECSNMVKDYSLMSIFETKKCFLVFFMCVENLWFFCLYPV